MSSQQIKLCPMTPICLPIMIWSNINTLKMSVRWHEQKRLKTNETVFNNIRCIDKCTRIVNFCKPLFYLTATSLVFLCFCLLEDWAKHIFIVHKKKYAHKLVLQIVPQSPHTFPQLHEQVQTKVFKLRVIFTWKWSSNLLPQLNERTSNL